MFGWIRSRFPQPDERGLLEIKRAVTIQRARDELFKAWLDFAYLPRFRGRLSGDIREQRAGELIRWRSRAFGLMPSGGEIRFENAPLGRGTEVRLRVEYRPVAGALGASIAQMLGQGPDGQVRESLRSFKQLCEAGEIPTNDTQPIATCRGA
jgi:uncharacterized membrane protein